jgi:hypothetical protein
LGLAAESIQQIDIELHEQIRKINQALDAMGRLIEFLPEFPDKCFILLVVLRHHHPFTAPPVNPATM